MDHFNDIRHVCFIQMHTGRDNKVMEYPFVFISGFIIITQQLTKDNEFVFFLLWTYLVVLAGILCDTCERFQHELSIHCVRIGNLECLGSSKLVPYNQHRILVRKYAMVH